MRRAVLHVACWQRPQMQARWRGADLALVGHQAVLGTQVNDKKLVGPLKVRLRFSPRSTSPPGSGPMQE